MCFARMGKLQASPDCLFPLCNPISCGSFDAGTSCNRPSLQLLRSLELARPTCPTFVVLLGCCWPMKCFRAGMWRLLYKSQHCSLLLQNPSVLHTDLELCLWRPSDDNHPLTGLWTLSWCNLRAKENAISNNKRVPSVSPPPFHSHSHMGFVRLSAFMCTF